MKYISTRGKDFASSIDDVLKKGIADDGGLFLPESLPIFKEKDFNDSKSLKQQKYFYPHSLSALH